MDHLTWATSLNLTASCAEMMVMWNRENPAERPNPSAREPLPEKGRNAKVGRSVCVKGTLSGSEDLTVDGRLEGRIELEGYALTIGPNASIKADVVASKVTIFGSVVGNVTAHDKAEIRRGGSLEGDVTSACIAIQEGAFLCGSVAMPRRTERLPEEAGPASPSTMGRDAGRPTLHLRSA